MAISIPSLMNLSFRSSKNLVDLYLMSHSVLSIVKGSDLRSASSPITVTSTGNSIFFLMFFIERLPLTQVFPSFSSTPVISNELKA